MMIEHPRRIAQIMLARGFGGAERSFVDATLALAERGHFVQAICHKDFCNIEMLTGHEHIRVDPVSAGGEFDFMAPRRIARLLQDFDAEVVHTQLKRAAWHGGRAAARVGIPSVAKLHNYVELKRYQQMTMLLCTTQDQVRHVIERGWDKARVRWIPNFSLLPAVDSVASDFRQPLQLLSYGRYVKKKGFDHLIQAMGLLHQRGIPVSLRIGGRGETLEELVEQTKELGVSEQVELGFWIDDVAVELDQADVFVLPSLDEPFGIVMLEAMARGVPIVTTRTKGPSEVLSQETASFVDIGSAVQLADAIQACYDNFPAAATRARKALELYRSSYQGTAVLPQIEQAYNDAIGFSSRA